MIMRGAVLLLGLTLGFATLSPAPVAQESPTTRAIEGITRSLGLGQAKNANLDELSKYLAFIEGFQHLFEFCQAETRLSEREVTYARSHIGERRALIFAGLNEEQRGKISKDSQPKKVQMVDAVLAHMTKEHPNKPLKELCKEGMFAGIVDSEKKAERKEEDAIRSAKK